MTNASERIWETARGFQTSRVLLTGVELGVFAALGDAVMTSSEVAKTVGADPRAADRLMNALVAIGFLSKEDGKFWNTADTADTLVPGKPGFVGAALMHMSHLWDNWSTLTDAVRAGTSVAKRGSGDWAKPFIAAMHVIASGQADKIVSQIDLSGAHRMIDIGGGSGAYSIAFCKANPDLNAVVFDMPEVVPLTLGYVEQAGMSARIKTHIGDFNEDAIPADFDFAYLSQVLHSNNADQNRVLIGKVFQSLNQGGQIAIQEFVMDEDRTSPPSHAFFALNMLVGTRAGDTFTESEISDWFLSAGFTRPLRIDPPTNTTLIIASKP
ncbi:MAG: methyltransferase [Armatimonadota bacterium]